MINVPKILNLLNWVVLILLIGTIGLVSLLTVIGGVQSGELTVSGSPIYLWDHKGIVYFFFACITLGGVLKPLLDMFEETDKKRKAEGKDTTSDGLLFVLILCGALWPVVWSLIVFEWFREKFKGEEK